MACIFVNANRSVGTINPNIYGQFSEHLGRCIYQGIYVGQASDIPNTNGMRNDVVSALKALHVPVLRWPGGCFADTYHWRDGIGPKENRKTIVNTNWGGVTEDNSFGTHEFMELCRQIGCEAYFSGNVGSGTVQEFSDWVEYCNMGGISPMASERRANGQNEPFNVKYWGIGNEAWGCGGSMRAEYYADLCRQYSTYLRNYSPEHKIFKITSGANVADYHWTKTVMERAGQAVDAVSLHYYTVPHEDWQHKGSATDFTNEEYYTTLHKTLQMEELVENHTRIIKQYQGDRKVGLAVDEWGTWYDVEPDTNPGFLYQQNTMRDALVAAINLNIFNNHCDTVCMANIAQMVNVLQAMILTEGSKMVLTPTYHVFEMYKGHQGAKQLESYAETTLLNHDDQAVPDLHVSASQQADGSILVTAANLNDTAAIPVTCMLGGAKPTGVTARVLAGAPAAHNTFAAPEQCSSSHLRLPLTLPAPLIETLPYSPPGMVLEPEIFISMCSFIRLPPSDAPEYPFFVRPRQDTNAEARRGDRFSFRILFPVSAFAVRLLPAFVRPAPRPAPRARRGPCSAESARCAGRSARAGNRSPARSARTAAGTNPPGSAPSASSGTAPRRRSGTAPAAPFWRSAPLPIPCLLP